MTLKAMADVGAVLPDPVRADAACQADAACGPGYSHGPGSGRPVRRSRADGVAAARSFAART